MCMCEVYCVWLRVWLCELQSCVYDCVPRCVLVHMCDHVWVWWWWYSTPRLRCSRSPPLAPRPPSSPQTIMPLGPRGPGRDRRPLGGKHRCMWGAGPGRSEGGLMSSAPSRPESSWGDRRSRDPRLRDIEGGPLGTGTGRDTEALSHLRPSWPGATKGPRPGPAPAPPRPPRPSTAVHLHAGDDAQEPEHDEHVGQADHVPQRQQALHLRLPAETRRGGVGGGPGARCPLPAARREEAGRT